MKIVLAGTIIIIAITQISEWMTEQPALGYPAFILVFGVWVYEAVKSWNGGRR